MPLRPGPEDQRDTQKRRAGSTIDLIQTANMAERGQGLSSDLMPVDGGWAVTIIQAAMTAGTGGEVRVAQTAGETGFAFQVESGWTLDAIEQSVLGAASEQSRSLGLLAEGLRSVGREEGRAFSLTLPRERQMLSWNGEKFERQDCPNPRGHFLLTVSHFQHSSDALTKWFQKKTKSAEINVGVSQAIAQRCFTAYRPLYLDGRRVDGFQFAPYQGLGARTFPIHLALFAGEGPRMRVPVGTMDGSEKENEGLARSEPLRRIASRSFSGVEDQEFTSALICAVHGKAETAGTSARLRGGVTGLSHCYWIRDGVVVDIDRLPISPGACSVGLIVSAEGLETDTSGESLMEGPHKERRLVEAARQSASAVHEIASHDFQTLVPKKTLKARLKGLGLAGLGVFATAFPTEYSRTDDGSVGAVIDGLRDVANPTWSEQSLVKDYRASLEKIADEWSNLTSGNGAPVSRKMTLGQLLDAPSIQGPSDC